MYRAARAAGSLEWMRNFCRPLFPDLHGNQLTFFGVAFDVAVVDAGIPSFGGFARIHRAAGRTVDGAEVYIEIVVGVHAQDFICVVKGHVKLEALADNGLDLAVGHFPRAPNLFLMLLFLRRLFWPRFLLPATGGSGCKQRQQQESCNSYSFYP